MDDVQLNDKNKLKIMFPFWYRWYQYRIQAGKLWFVSLEGKQNQIYEGIGLMEVLQ